MTTTTTNKPPAVTARMRQQAARIEKRRTRLGLTKRALGRHAGISSQMIRVLEEGRIPERSNALPAVLDTLAELEKNGA